LGPKLRFQIQNISVIHVRLKIGRRQLTVSASFIREKELAKVVSSRCWSSQVLTDSGWIKEVGEEVPGRSLGRKILNQLCGSPEIMILRASVCQRWMLFFRAGWRVSSKLPGTRRGSGPNVAACAHPNNSDV
jgi:hypothetical protein